MQPVIVAMSLAWERFCMAGCSSLFIAVDSSRIDNSIDFSEESNTEVRNGILMLAQPIGSSRAPIRLLPSTMGILLLAGRCVWAVDCNGNNIEDLIEVILGLAPDCNDNRVPDECDITADIRFDRPRGVNQGVSLNSLHIADLDGDGDNDLLSTDLQFGIHLLLNQGDGSFAAPQLLGLDGEFWVSALEDLEGDGDWDLILRERISRTLRIFHNDGSASFIPGEVIVVEETEEFADLDDLDGDRDLDLILTAREGKVVFLFQENGAFRRAGVFETMVQGGQPLMGDFDGDEVPDLAVSSKSQEVIRVFLNDGKGSFGPFKDTVMVLSWNVRTAELNGDGDSDLLVYDAESGDFTIHLNQGHGTFSTGPIISTEWKGAVLALSDIDIDGDLDVVVGSKVEEWCAPTAAIGLLLNDGGDRWIQTAETMLGPFSTTSGLVAGDLDLDGIPDLLIRTFPVCHCCLIDGRPSVVSVLNRTIPASSRDLNRNRFPDECEGIPFRRGDPNVDGVSDISDVVTVLQFLFSGRVRLTCMEAADINNDGAINIGDVIHLLEFHFLGGPAPPIPGSDPRICGHDHDLPGSLRNLGCDSYDRCP